MLSKLDRWKLQKLKEMFSKNDCIYLSDKDKQLLGSLLDFLETNDVIRNLHVDGANAYIMVGSIEIFEENLKDFEAEIAREKHSERWHDFWMVVLGAVLGGVVTVCLYKFFGIG